MDKARRDDPDIADEYDFSRAAPNPYADRMRDGSSVRRVSDEDDRRRLESQVSRTKDIQGGTPVFAGTRVPIEILFDYIQHDGLTEFLKQHPTVTRAQAIAVLEEAKRGLLAPAPTNEAKPLSKTLEG